MSIGSIVQTIQTQSPYTFQPSTGATASPSDPFALASSASSSSSSASAVGGNTMQSLTSDIQSALLSLQSINGSGTTATAQQASATSTAASPAATATNPFQSLSSDLQSALLNLQSVDGNGSTTAQQTGGAAHPHRGHHHGGGGGMAPDATGGVQADAPSLPGATQSSPTTTT